MVVIAGYLVWLRSKVQAPVSPQITEVEVSPSPEVEASPGAKEATPATKQKTSTPGGTAR